MDLAEKIVRKQYNVEKQQYEYLIKWLVYAQTENTWELVDNIPDDMLTAFEENLLQTLSGVSSHLTTRKEGLGQTCTVTQKKITSSIYKLSIYINLLTVIMISILCLFDLANVLYHCLFHFVLSKVAVLL